MARMTASEAFVETLVAQGVKDVFGIVGSAYMDALDLFPPAGIRFIPIAHEQGAGHMADGYSRVSGRHGVCIAQNGPGITNFVTSIAAAYWAHSPVVVDHAGDRLRHASGSAASRRPSSCRSSRRSPSTRRMSTSIARMAELTGALLRHGDARARAGAAQHPARLFLRRGRLRDSATPQRVARGAGGRGQPRRGGRAAGQGASSR